MIGPLKDPVQIGEALHELQLAFEAEKMITSAAIRSLANREYFAQQMAALVSAIPQNSPPDLKRTGELLRSRLDALIPHNAT
jgi:hypothetical protein